VRCGPVTSYSILKIINLELTLSLLTCILRTWPSWLEINRNNMISEIPYIFFLIFFHMINRSFFIQRKQSYYLSFLPRIFLTSCNDQCISNVIKIGPSVLNYKARLRWRLIFHFNVRIHSFFYPWIINYAPLKKNVHIDLVIFLSVLGFKQKYINYAA